MKEYICIYDEDDMMYILNPYVAQNTELIRCKDCKHYAGGTACFKTDAMFTASEDGYCSWAERKAE